MSDPNPSTGPYLSAPEAAAYMRISISWLRKKTAAGEIAHAKLGNRVVYERKDLDEYIQCRKTQTSWARWDRR